MDWMHDVATAASSQARCAGVRAIIHPLDHLLHPLAGRLRDATPAAQDVGNRLGRHVGGTRHVADGDSGFVRHKIFLDFSATDESLVTLCLIDKPHHSDSEPLRPSAPRTGGCRRAEGVANRSDCCVRYRFRPFEAGSCEEGRCRCPRTSSFSSSEFTISRALSSSKFTTRTSSWRARRSVVIPRSTLAPRWSFRVEFVKT